MNSAADAETPISAPIPVWTVAARLADGSPAVFHAAETTWEAAADTVTSHLIDETRELPRAVLVGIPGGRK